MLDFNQETVFLAHEYFIDDSFRFLGSVEDLNLLAHPF